MPPALSAFARGNVDLDKLFVVLSCFSYEMRLVRSVETGSARRWSRVELAGYAIGVGRQMRSQP